MILVILRITEDECGFCSLLRASRTVERCSYFNHEILGLNHVINKEMEFLKEGFT